MSKLTIKRKKNGWSVRHGKKGRAIFYDGSARELLGNPNFRAMIFRLDDSYKSKRNYVFGS